MMMVGRGQILKVLVSHIRKSRFFCLFVLMKAVGRYGIILSQGIL